VLIEDELERIAAWRQLAQARLPGTALGARDPALPLSRDPDAILGWLRRDHALFGLPAPQARVVDVHDLPDRPRRLLAHNQSMTRTLEAEYRRPMGLRVLAGFERDGHASRHVLLVHPSGAPVVLATITIALSMLPEEARIQVAEQRVPLGRVLAGHGIRYASHPLGYFAIIPDERTTGLFGLRRSDPLHGRVVVLADDDRRILAHGFEVLGPADAS